MSGCQCRVNYDRSLWLPARSDLALPRPLLGISDNAYTRCGAASGAYSSSWLPAVASSWGRTRTDEALITTSSRVPRAPSTGAKVPVKVT